MERFDIRGRQLSDKENWQRGHFLSIGRPIRESELTPSEGASFDLGQFVEAQTLEGLILSRIEKPFCTFTFLTYIVEMKRGIAPLHQSGGFPHQHVQDIYLDVFNRSWTSYPQGLGVPQNRVVRSHARALRTICRDGLPC
jgi:hypothetical protein